MELSALSQLFVGWNIDMNMIFYTLAGSTCFVYLIKLISDFVWKNYFATLTIPSTDSRYDWMLHWLSIHGPLKDCQHLSMAVREPRNQGGMRSFRDNKQESEANDLKYTLLPRTCSYYFTDYKSGKLMHLQFIRARDNGNSFFPLTYANYDNIDTIVISTSGRSRGVLEDLVMDAGLEYRKKHFGKVLVYHYEKSYGDNGYWALLNNPTMYRPWDSVVTKNNIKENILEDIKEFQTSENHYKSRGIPYRRGYLLHGPPGTGKSSLIHSLASELQYSLCVVNLSRDVSDFDLLRQLATAPKKSILLFEDVDVTLPSDKRKKEMKQRDNEFDSSHRFSGYISLSGLLNALDGISASDSHLVFMTTNHITNLDPALIRPGRIDARYYLGNCNAKQAISMFENAYRDEKVDRKKLQKLFDDIKVPVSPAKLQNHLLKYKDQPEAALTNIFLLREEPQVYEEDRTAIYRCQGYESVWMPFGNGKNVRPWDSIITQDNIKEDLLQDLEEFLNSKELYNARGITHRKGYLLYGPPGTGKSTLIAGLADKLRLNLCMVELNSDDMSDSKLITQLSKTPGRSIVVMEEIDMALPSKDRRMQIQKTKEETGQYGPASRVSLGGVLHALDGLCTAESQIVIMTTNYIDDLDPALIRPGRVDQKFYLGNCNKEQIEHMLTTYYANDSTDDIEKLVEKIAFFEHPVSPALLECFMLRHSRNAEDALTFVEELLDMAKENGEKEKISFSRYNSRIGVSTDEVLDNMTDEVLDKLKDVGEVNEEIKSIGLSRNNSKIDDSINANEQPMNDETNSTSDLPDLGNTDHHSTY